MLSLQNAPALAQGSARSMDIDVSIRSAGMGGASNAVLWGRGLNHWANPALLGAEHGIRWEWGRTQLVPDLASDVVFESHVVKIAGGGLGLVSSGLPFGPGVRLGYGVSEGTDDSGNPTGTFESFERVESWGFGISAFEAVETLAQLRDDDDEPGPLSRYVDFAFGMNFKDVKVSQYPGASAGTTARDWGVAARFTPVDLRTDGGTAVRIDATIGVSVLNANDDAWIDIFWNGAVSRHRRAGMGLHLAIDPRSGRHSDPDGGSWLEEGMSPLLSVGIAADRSRISAGPPENGLGLYETEGAGVEVALANILWGRAGHYTDRKGDIDDATWGWGIQLPLGRVAGIRYDGALFPQSNGLKSVQRHGASIWLDPFELVRVLEKRRSAII